VSLYATLIIAAVDTTFTHYVTVCVFQSRIRIEGYSRLLVSNNTSQPNTVRYTSYSKPLTNKDFQMSL